VQPDTCWQGRCPLTCVFTAWPPTSCSIHPARAYVLTTDAAHGATAQQTTAKGGVPASKIAAGPWRQASTLAPVQPGHALCRPAG
jgi:hypothetical protein